MEIPKHYSLHSESDSHFVIHDKRDGKTFNVAKKQLHPAHQIKIMKMQKMSMGGVSGEPGDVDDVETAGGDTTEEDLSAQPSGATAQYDVPVQAQPNNENATVAQGGATGSWDGPSSDPAASVGPTGPNYPSSAELQKYTNAQVGGLQQESKAQQAQNTALAAQQQKNIDEQMKYQQVQQQKMNEYQMKYDQLSSEVANSKIDPNKYWHDKSTGGKISAAIGMILGGLGSGLTHGPNVAIDMLNKHIENDIEAQKESLGSKRSLLSENLRAQGNMLAAENATRIQMSAIADGRLKQVAAQTGNPIIAARAQQQAAAIQQGTMNARMGLANNEYQMAIKRDVLHRLSGQGQPGVQPVDMMDLGRAGIVDPATAQKEGAAIQKRQQAEAYVMDQFQKMDKEQTIPNLLNPASYTRVKQDKAGIIQAIQSASSSKKLSPEMIAQEVEPFFTGTFEGEKSRKNALNGIIGLIRSHADETPHAVHYNVPGANDPKRVVRKDYDEGPVK